MVKIRTIHSYSNYPQTKWSEYVENQPQPKNLTKPTQNRQMQNFSKKKKKTLKQHDKK
jgi:hypothetical protein